MVPGNYLLIGSLLSNLNARQGPMYRFKGQMVWGCEFSADELETALTAQDRFAIVQRTEDVQVRKPPANESGQGPEPDPIDQPLPLGLPPLPAGLSPNSPTQWFTILAQKKL